jgi:DME family drug/metabolite transporter
MNWKWCRSLSESGRFYTCSVLTDASLVVPMSLVAAFLLGSVGLIMRLGLVYGRLQESVLLTFLGCLSAVTPLLVLTAWPVHASARAVLFFALDGVLGFLAVVLLYTGVKLVGPSISYALKSTAPLTAVALAALVLHEIEHWPVYLGVLLAVVGVALLSVERIGGELSFDRRILYPLLGAIFFGAASILRRSAMPEISSPLAGLTLSLVFSLVSAVIWLWLGRQRLGLNRGTSYFFIGGAIQGLALVLVYTALSIGHVAVVVPLYTSSPLFILVLSPIVLRRLERLTPRIVGGALTVLTAVLLISANQ